MNWKQYDEKHMITLQYAGFGTRIVQDRRDGRIYIDDGIGLSPYDLTDVQKKVKK